MALKPTGHRILVKPDAQKTETDAGLVLLESRHHVSVSGTVVAVGSGPQWGAELKRNLLRDVRGIIDEVADIFPNEGGVPFVTLREEIGRYAQRAPCPSELQVGDRVVFPATAGQNIGEDGESYVLMTEDDVLAVVSEEEEVEAVA